MSSHQSLQEFTGLNLQSMVMTKIYFIRNVFSLKLLLEQYQLHHPSIKKHRSFTFIHFFLQNSIYCKTFTAKLPFIQEFYSKNLAFLCERNAKWCFCRVRIVSVNILPRGPWWPLFSLNWLKLLNNRLQCQEYQKG